MVFSVIVPVYNVEKYLSDCVDSVLTQTFDDFELILVDDGSTDSCGKICDDYAQKDYRIKVIHQKNRGLAGARQTGIQAASGEYVFNLDSDDRIEQDTLECAYHILCESKPDIISFSYRWFTENATISITHDGLEEGLYEEEAIRKHIFPRLLMGENMNHVSVYLSGKAVRREFVLPHQLAVDPNISLGEDLCCTFPCYLTAKKVYISKKNAYWYRVRTDSLSKKFNTEQIFKVQQVTHYLSQLPLKKPNDFDAQLSRYYAFMCFAILAAAAEGGHFECIDELRDKIVHSDEFSYIRQAQFAHITMKTRIGMYLMKQKRVKLLFYFLNACKRIKTIRKKG